MKTYKFSYCLLLILFLLLNNLIYGQSIQSFSKTKSLDLIEELALMLVLVEDFELAAEAYDYLSKEKPGDLLILNNAAANFTLAALDQFKSDELKYYIPIELSVRNRVRGTRSSPYTEDEIKQIRIQLNKAEKIFQKVINRNKEWNTAYLNYAMCKILAQRFNKTDDYASAYQAAIKALELSKSPRSKANAYIVLAILYDLTEDTNKRDEMLLEAKKLLDNNIELFNFSETTMIENNIKIANEDPNLVSTNRKSPEIIRPGLKEKIEDIRLRKSFVKALSNSTQVNFENEFSINIIISLKKLQQSYIIGIEKGEKQYLFHRTLPNYTGATARKIKIGSHENEILGDDPKLQEKNLNSDPYDVKYWKPWKEYPIGNGGKFMVYKHAKVIFQINSRDTVAGWTNWAFRWKR